MWPYCMRLFVLNERRYIINDSLISISTSTVTFPLIVFAALACGIYKFSNVANINEIAMQLYLWFLSVKAVQSWWYQALTGFKPISHVCVMGHTTKIYDSEFSFIFVTLSILYQQPFSWDKFLIYCNFFKPVFLLPNRRFGIALSIQITEASDKFVHFFFVILQTI